MECWYGHSFVYVFTKSTNVGINGRLTRPRSCIHIYSIRYWVLPTPIYLTRLLYECNPCFGRGFTVYSDHCTGVNTLEYAVLYVTPSNLVEFYFRRNLMPPSSVPKSKQGKKPRWKAAVFGAITASQVLVITAVKASNPIYLHLFYDLYHCVVCIV